MSQPTPEEESPIKAVTKHYSVDQILEDRARIRTALAETYRDQSPEGDSFQLFVADLLSYLPKTINRDKVIESVEYLAGQKLTLKVIDGVVWRLLGNMSLLTHADRVTVPPWIRQPYAEWVPAQIVSARRRRDKRGKAGHLFYFQALAGLCAGLKMTKFWSDKFCFSIKSDFGFVRFAPSEKSSRSPQNVFTNPLEFVQMRITLLIDPKLCTHREPGFDKIRFTASNLEWNRLQMKYRDRLEPQYECPQGIPNYMPCFICQYGVESCRVAVHLKDYKFDYCDKCKREKAPHDDTVTTEMCVECHEAAVMSRKT